MPGRTLVGAALDGDDPLAESIRCVNREPLVNYVGTKLLCVLAAPTNVCWLRDSEGVWGIYTFDRNTEDTGNLTICRRLTTRLANTDMSALGPSQVHIFIF